MFLYMCMYTYFFGFASQDSGVPLVQLNTADVPNWDSKVRPMPFLTHTQHTPPSLTHTHTRTALPHTRTHTYKHTRAHTHTYTYTYIYSDARKERAHVHTKTRTHAHTPLDTRGRTGTHTSLHSRIDIQHIDTPPMHIPHMDITHIDIPHTDINARFTVVTVLPGNHAPSLRIYVCICVCVCKHASCISGCMYVHMCIYHPIGTCVRMCVCVCVCVCVFI